MTRSCPACGAAAHVGEPCLRCALAQVLIAPLEPSADAGAAAGLPPFDPTSLPSHFGRYEVRKEIAIGGMGAVYEAYDTRLGRTVALKLMRSLLLSTAEEKARFRTEAEAAAQLDHPHIVPIYEVGELGGQPYFTMKLISGRSLAEHVKDRVPPAEEVVELMIPVARAVEHAHTRGVVHRDLKPGNILLDDQGKPWLTDFGLAKLVGSGSDLTRTGASLGTPEFMSPEQVDGRTGESSAASDVWALGAMLFQMLTGRLPFQGHSTAEVFRRIREEEPGSGAYDRDGAKMVAMPPDLATVVRRCLQKDPASRPPGALYLAEELERWLAGDPVFSKPVSLAGKAVRWLRRHPWPISLVLASGLACLTLIQQWIPSASKDPHRPTGALFLNGRESVFECGSPLWGADGWLYGTAASGGKFGFGAVFRFDVNSPGKFAIVAHFSGASAVSGGLAGKGAATLARGRGDGEIFGATEEGGHSDNGTIFRVSADGSTETLYEFGAAGGGRRPFEPQLLSDGWLWGCTDRGGEADKGCVYRFHPVTRQYETLFSCGGSDDPIKSGRGCGFLCEVAPGNKLFMAGGGEVGTSRTLFSLSGTGPARPLHVFPALGALGDVDAITGFVVAPDQAVYFATQGGGNHNLGTIQRIDADSSQPVVVHHFAGPEGSGPSSRLFLLPDGRLCGATTVGGAYSQGCIFAFSPRRNAGSNAGGEIQRLVSLHHSDAPTRLTLGHDGNIYGSLIDYQRGSRYFRSDPSRPGSFQVIARFPFREPVGVPAPAAQPGRLVLGAEDWFYGGCSVGGTAGYGSLFRWKPGSSPEMITHFTGDHGEVPGAYPIGQLAIGSDLALYGVTRRGGGGSLGTVYRVDPETGNHMVLASMEGLETRNCGMALATDGSLYGTTAFGGAAACGSIFSVTPPHAGKRALVETIAEFTGSRGAFPGNRPGSLLAAEDGNLYGVTHRPGWVFCIDADGVRSLGPLRLKEDHPAPSCLLAPSADHWFYGLPMNGKHFTLFRFQPQTGISEVITGADGRGWGYTGWCGLVSDGRGGFLTVSANLGKAGFGGILRLLPDGRFETVAEFTGKGGALPGTSPMSELLPVGGDFYGTCQGGGTNGRGVIFKLTVAGDVHTLAEF